MQLVFPLTLPLSPLGRGQGEGKTEKEDSHVLCDVWSDDSKDWCHWIG